jgi:general secretion pathway protein L
MRRSQPARAAILQLHLPEGWPENAASNPRFRFALYDGRKRSTGVARLPDVPRATTVIVVTPASVASLVRATLPPADAGRMSALLAHAVEDTLATSPEEVHAVLVEHVPDGQSLVAVVNRLWLRQAIDALEAAGLAPARIVLETELASQRYASEAANTWLIVRSPSGGFAIIDQGEVVTLDAGETPALPPLALHLLRDLHRRRGEVPDEAVVLTASGARNLDYDRWSFALGLPIKDGGKWRPEQIDARGLRSSDLLRGEFAPAWRMRDIAPALRFAAVAAASLLALHALLTAGDWWRLSREFRQLHAGMEARFRQVFPEAQSIVDPPLQMHRNLVDLRRQAGIADASDFIPLLAAIAPSLDAAGIEVEKLRYERGELELQVRLPQGLAPASLESAGLGKPGYRARIEQGSTSAQRDVAVLRFRADT